MAKYLYGAAVQGIQGFIFQTNKLRDIVGASELVERICTTDFDEFTESHNGANDPKSILRAAGNIKYLFESEDACKKAVLKFPKKVVENAPGITISQAVVPVEDDADIAAAIDKLEASLRVQRNRQMRPINLGFTGVLRSRSTGFPAVEVRKDKNGQDEFLDKATQKKRDASETQALSKKAFGFDVLAKQVAFEIDQITGKNDWIAVIHADGNGLGQVVQKVGKKTDEFKAFSKALDEATIGAAVDAFNALVERKYFDVKDESKLIPIRPVVLGGDDFTVICRADFAAEYVHKFLESFEKRTGEGVIAELLKKNAVFENGNKLTACAGIAFVKSSYPFYYAYDLAESLCSMAKKDAKKPENPRYLAPSCLMFHKVQSSFVESFDKIVDKELTASGCSYVFGPYYLAETPYRWTVDKLMEVCDLLDGEDGNALKSNVRQWLTLQSQDAGMAKQKAERIVNILEKSDLRPVAEELVQNKVQRNGEKYSPAYDVLSLHSVRYQETRSAK